MNYVVELFGLVILIAAGVTLAVVWLCDLWLQRASAAKKPGKYSLTSRHIVDNDGDNSNG